MTKFVAQRSIDFSSWDLQSLQQATLLSKSAAAFQLRAPDGNHYIFQGSGLSGFNANLPANGTITSISVTGHMAFSLSGLNIPAERFDAYVASNDAAGLEKEIFAGNDAFNLSSSPRSIVSGEAGNDTFSFGSSFLGRDRIDGGTGTDTIKLDGDYAHTSRLTNQSFTNIEKFDVLGAHSYNFALKDGNIAAGQTMTVNAQSLDQNHVLVFEDGKEKDGNLHVLGGAGNDKLAAGHGNDNLNGGGGNDKLYFNSGSDRGTGGSGNDYFHFSGTFDATDRMDGGSGINSLSLNGDYSGGLAVSASMMQNIENIHLLHGHSYDLNFSDGVIAAGKSLLAVSRNLSSSDHFTLDDSAERDGTLTVRGGRGVDVVTTGSADAAIYGGNGSDTVHAGAGDELIKGGNGKDNFYFGATFGAGDNVDGGGGSDTLHLSTPVSGLLNVALDRANMHSIEHVDLGDGDYDISVAPGGLDVANIEINALKVDAAHTVTIDGSAALATAFTLVGGAGDNILTGGLGNDTLIAGLGSNILNGGGGHDTFVFDSLGSADQIVNFDGALDTLDVGHAVTGIDTSLLGGLLNDLGGLGTLVGSLLGAHHAMEISPILGALAGDNFLVIDQNGQSGFQAGQDLVVQLENATHLGSLGLGNFGI